MTELVLAFILGIALAVAFVAGRITAPKGTKITLPLSDTPIHVTITRKPDTP